MLALTATLRKADEALLQDRLGMDPKEAVLLQLPVRRKNVSLHVMQKGGIGNNMIVLAGILREHKGSKFVFRIGQDVVDTEERLTAAGEECGTYHGADPTLSAS